MLIYIYYSRRDDQILSAFKEPQDKFDMDSDIMLHQEYVK